jgi:hypothetical protein
VAKFTEFKQPEFNEWVKTRPDYIQELIEKYPPDALYRINKTGQIVTIYLYSEDGTVTVDVSGEFNLQMIDLRVFGVDPLDLTECDLPEEIVQ